MKTSYTFTSVYQSPIDKLVGLLRRESISYARITDGVRILNLAPNDLVMIRAKIQEFGNITETIDTLDETAEDNQVGLCIPFDRSLTVPAEVMLKSLSAQIFKAVSSITSMKVIDKADYTGELPESFTDKDIFLLEIRGIQKQAKNNTFANDVAMLQAMSKKK